MVNVEIFENLKRAVIEYDSERAMDWTRKSFEKEIDPVEVLDVLTEAIRQIGNAYNRGELWLPDLVGAATVMQKTMPIIEERLKRTKKKQKFLGRVVIGTVYGDIHNIGKDMVATLLVAWNFAVHDLGVNVEAEKFIEAIKKYNPDILAMSALMTTTMPEQRKVIEMLEKAGLRDKVKVMVGGGSVTRQFANEIGADGCDSTASGAVGLAKWLMGIQ